MAQDNKEVKISFRLTEEEGDLLNQLAQREGIDPSKYLRNIIRNQERAFTLSPDEISLLKSYFANITRLGGNINQITYHLNLQAFLGKKATLGHDKRQDLEGLLIQTDRTLNEIKKQIIKLIKVAK